MRWYSAKIHVWSERKKFKSANMAEGERVNDWFNRIKELSRNCEFAQPDDEVRDQLIVGLPTKLSEKVLDLAPEATLEQALTECADAEIKCGGSKAGRGTTA